ncbi:MAG: SUMF1/EgtB/PvdO family nonheme iron enzyme [Planctomycetes bacterium]|nr:SUMF1/EgtB/PvdO family nonheme iron enzyme [Planctomycetota bacterium]
MQLRLASLPVPMVVIACVLPPLGGSETAPAVGLRTDCRSHSNGQTSGAIPTNMVLVPGGSFTMGVPEKLLVKWLESDNDTRSQAAEHLAACYPDHNEVCEDLLVDKYETSNLQFKTWLDAHGMQPDEYTIKYNWSAFKNGKLIEGLPAGQEQNPMRAVSADEARGALRWIGKRLPTEIEWAYVATRGLKPDQAYPWGGTYGTWDPTKCANSSNSSRGAAGPQTFPPGSWKEDVTVDGVFDVCGNVCEWTSSPFLQFPGFQPLEIKDGKQKRKLRGRFSAEEVAVRGGSFFGNQITNNVFWRKGEMPASRFEGVGFRGVMSALPGLDALSEAQKALTMLASDFKGRLELTKDGIAGQVLQYVDPDTNVVRGGKHLAFTRVTSVLAPMMKVERDSVEKPVLLGILTVSSPIAEPNLPAGNYGIYFKGKGASDAQKQAEEEAKKAGKNGKKADGDKKDGDKKDADKKDEKKDDKKNDKRAPKSGEKKDAPAEGDKPAEGEKKEGEAPAEEEDPGKKALEAIGAVKAAPVSLVELPKDRAIFLIKNEADAIVGWLDAKFVPDQAHHPVRLSYKPGARGSGKSTAAAGGSPMVVAEHDAAKLVFTVKMGTGTKFPQFEVAMKFAAGSFEPVE